MDVSSKEKNHELYLRQKELLDTFLMKHAISQAQYNKSLHDLTVKMGEEIPQRKTVRVVAAVIHQDGRIFATQRGYGDFKDGWEFPGGKIEEGETAQAALVREIREELAAEIRVGEKITTVEYDYPQFHLSMDCFWAALLPDSNMKLLEHEAAKWLDQDSIRSVDWLPADIEVVNIVTNSLLKGDYGDSMRKKKGVIFDMDGTVWDSSENVAASWTEMIKKAGYQEHFVTRDDITGVMGKPMDVIADTLFTYTTEGPERDALRAACENYENEYLREHGGILYDGVFETWEKLKKMGYHVYIVSNCQAGYIEAFLEHYGISYGTEEDLVEDIECYGNNFLQKDENIRLIATRNALTSSCYVGDIQSDYDATTAAGLPFIHARYGFGTIHAEVPYIDHFSELLKVVPEVIG